MRFWTQPEKDVVAIHLRGGKSASQIGVVVGRPRNAVIGIVRRDKGLAAIGFSRQGTSSPDHTPITSEEQRRRKRIANAKSKAKLRGNVIAFPKPYRSVASDQPKPDPVALRVVSNNIPLMVQDWLAKHGGPRRFAEKEETGLYAVTDYLIQRGVMVKLFSSNWNRDRGKYNVSTGSGRPKVLTWAGVLQIVDGFRIAEGLQPFGCLRRALDKPAHSGAVA